MEDLLRSILDSGTSRHEPFASAPAPGDPEPSVPAAAEPPAALDVLRRQAMVYEALHRVRDHLIAQFAPAPRPFASAESAADDPLVSVLRHAQMLLLKHPIAAQAAFAALVAEGRRFATTPEGQTWKAALASSELVRGGRRVWDAVSLNMLEDDPSTIVPSAYLEALLSVARSGDIEGLLRRLHEVE